MVKMAASTFRLIPISRIRPSPYQARKKFDEEALNALADSLRQEGLIEPIVVREIPELGNQAFAPQSENPKSPIRNPKFELISGERRLRAAKMIGWESIEAKIITTISEGEAAAKGLIENLQREDLDPIEEAEAFEALNKVDSAYWTQDRISKAVGRTPTYVSRSLQLLSLPRSIQEDLRHRKLSRNHGVELARLPSERLQLDVAEKIPDHLTVKETRRIVDSILIRGRPASGRSRIRKSDAGSGNMEPFSETDPLEGLWASMLADEKIGPLGSWNVDYRFGGWNFWIKDTGPGRREDLAAWFRSLSGWFEHLLRVQKVPSAAFDHITPQRLPATPAEEEEVLQLAKRGPELVYGWIYGPDSLVARSLQRSSWDDLSGPGTDPETAARDLIKALRAIHAR